MAAQVPSNGLNVDKGLSFPATVAGQSGVNVLDDYEEGTFTGLFSTDAGNYTMQSGYSTGYYTKVGNVVSVQAYLAGQSESLDDGHQVKITGLPFTALNENSGSTAITVGYAAALNITAGHAVTGYVKKNTTEAPLQVFDAAGGSTSMNVGELSADGEIKFSGTYRVA